MRFSFSLAVLVSTAFASSTEHQKLKRAPGSSKPNGYIVKLKNGASRQNSIATLTSLPLGPESVCEIGYSHWTIINGYSARLSGACLQHVLTDPDVEYVEEDGVFTIDFAISPRAPSPAPNPVPEDVKVTNNDGTPCNGEGTTFYGIDTGIRISHHAFSGRAFWGATFGGYPDEDDNGHGTHTAGTAVGENYGPATRSQIYAVKVLSGSGSGSFSDVISGIDWAVDHAVASGRPSVVNMSLGGPASQAVDDAVKAGIDEGIHFTIAAGNSNMPAGGTSPARVQEAVTVGAVDSQNNKACFSNYGSELDVWDLGVAVVSAWNIDDDAEIALSGTSMAAPGVNGKLLVALSKYGPMAPADLITKLKDHADHVVKCSALPCETDTLAVPSAPQQCSLMMTTDLLARAW